MADLFQVSEIEVINRVCELPVIKFVLNTSAVTYSRVKNSNQLIHWAFMTAESSLTMVARQAVPIAKKLETPINFVDRTLCRGLDSIEMMIPSVQKSKELFYDSVATLTMLTAIPGIQVNRAISYTTNRMIEQASNIKNKMYMMLNAPLVRVALYHFDSYAHLFEQMVDLYLPQVEEETFTDDISIKNDIILSVVHDIGRIHHKIVHRSYSHAILSVQFLYKNYFLIILDHLKNFFHFIPAVVSTSV